MKKLFIIFTAILTLSPLAVKAENLSASCEQSGSTSTRRCILDAIRAKNKTNEADSEFKPWIGLQIGIPVPNGLCNSDEYLCYQGQLVGVKDASGMLVALFQFAIIMVSITLSVVMVIGGVMYITSGGDASRASKGRDYIKRASFSLVVLMFSVLLLYQINPKLISVNITSTGSQIQTAALECPDSNGYACGLEYTSPYFKSATSAKCVGTYLTPEAIKNSYCAPCDDRAIAAGVDCETMAKGKVTKTPLPLKADGVECKSDQECKSSLCFGVKCTPIPRTWGNVCDYNNECSGLVCETDGTNSCSLGRLGADCDPGSNTECADGYTCYDGPDFLNFCIKPGAGLLQFCGDDKQCARDQKCVSSTCVPKNIDSAYCTTDKQCETIVNLPADSVFKPKCLTSIHRCSTTLVGSACVSDSDCKSNHCLSFFTGVAVCTLGAPGDSCINNADCSSNKCIPSPGATTGRCE